MQPELLPHGQKVVLKERSPVTRESKRVLRLIALTCSGFSSSGMVLPGRGGYFGGGARAEVGASPRPTPRSSALKDSWPRPRPRDMAAAEVEVKGQEKVIETPQSGSMEFTSRKTHTDGHLTSNTKGKLSDLFIFSTWTSRMRSADDVGMAHVTNSVLRL